MAKHEKFVEICDFKDPWMPFSALMAKAFITDHVLQELYLRIETCDSEHFYTHEGEKC